MTFDDVPQGVAFHLGCCAAIYKKVGYYRFSTDEVLYCAEDGHYAIIRRDNPIRRMAVRLRKVAA